MQKKQSKKSVFVSDAIRSLTEQEKVIYEKVEAVLCGNSERVEIARTQRFVSYDKKARSLIFSAVIARKIIQDHGVFVLENFVINAMDWEYVIVGVDGNLDKINFIKKVPGSDNYLTIGANRDNGFFIVTHYEAFAKDSEKLKNLLKNKGDALDRTGRAVVPSFATPSEEDASQLDLSGVRTDRESVAD